MAEQDTKSTGQENLNFDEETLRAIAKVYLEEGNTEYRRKAVWNAIYFFTEGIQVNCKDVQLNAKLCSSRATAHCKMGNYEETLNDATVAVQLDPTLIKAIERGADACVQLQCYEEAISWCSWGLAIDENSNTLLDLWTRCQSNTLLLTEEQYIHQILKIRFRCVFKN